MKKTMVVILPLFRQWVPIKIPIITTMKIILHCNYKSTKKNTAVITRFYKQTERDSPLLEDLSIVVQRKDANQINNRNDNKKRTQQLQRYVQR